MIAPAAACPACRGRGRISTYLGMAGDHDDVERTCGQCRGTGRAPAAQVSPGQAQGTVTLVADLDRVRAALAELVAAVEAIQVRVVSQ